MLPAGSPLKRYGALDGWRGVAALFVAAHHFEIQGAIYWSPFTRNTWPFVDFFFVLSGFVMAYVYGGRLNDTAQAREFAVRRFARLWPLHAATLAALIALEFSRLVLAHLHPVGDARIPFTGDRSIGSIVSNLFLVQALGLHSAETWNGPAWSISVEFATYLVFAFVWLMLRDKRAKLIAAALISVAGAVALALFSQEGMRETAQWPIGRCFYGFFAGVLAYSFVHTRAGQALKGTVLEIAAIVLTMAFMVWGAGRAGVEYLAVPVFFFAVCVFANESGALSRLLKLPPAAALGRWSYSIYMVHTFLIAVIFSLVHVAEVALHRHWLVRFANGHVLIDTGSDFGAIVAMAAFLASVVGVSALTYRYIELPGQRWFGPRRRPQQTLVPALQSS